MNVALRPNPIRYGSICTGGGGLDLGFELAFGDARPAFMVEREAFAAAHLVSAMQSGLMAKTPLWSDAKTFNGRPWRGAVDCLIGGIPCQPHSAAGLRLGEDDERDLWPTFRRILVQSGAPVCLIENVAGMLTASDGRMPGAERVRRDLQRLGFVVEGGLFSAAEVGASHERARVFILAVADLGNPAIPRSHAPAYTGTGGSDEIVGPRDAQPERRSRDVVDAANSDWELHARSRTSGSRTAYPRRRSKALADPFGCRHHGRETEQERGAEQRAIAQGAGRSFPPGPNDLDGWWREINTYGADRLPALSRYDRYRIALRALLDAAQVDRDEGQRLDARGPGSLCPPGVQAATQPDIRRMAYGMAQSMDDAFTWKRSDRLRLLGNGVVPLQAAYAIRTLVTRLAARGSRRAAELVRMMEMAA